MFVGAAAPVTAGGGRLTLLVYRHHHGPVVGVDVEQRGCPHQVLRQVAQQRHRPADTMKLH